MNDRADDIHEWDAAYVLGSLSATDRALFEAHLEGCDACMRSLAELSGLPGVLRMLPVEEAIALMDEPEAPAVPQPAPEPRDRPAPAAAHRVPRRRRRTPSVPGRPRLSRRAGAWILAAAAVVLLVGGAGLGSALRADVSAPVADPSPAASSPAADEDLSTGLPADAVSMRSELDEGVTAQLAVTAKPYGTRFDWSCAYAGGGIGQGAYDLVAIADDGSRTVVATWGAGQTESRQLAATSSISVERLRTVQITPSDSDVVLASRDL
ncbi:anti-sigma factor family protein [Clavibacter michiganensis]|uniref:Conserved membrane protein, anti-sigma factor n=2 Tax=Clavibacter michiganensis TaxID=28447 RepID=A0A0D5CEB0_9MICO|nr:zf-HC2 domain-containing protein [Clavibacter michiganensis]AJW77951.1 conserved membrane protein, anti-sigma factor [Clavibacter michiganensis subsp. insidiosus]AWF97125.1 anti-sigma factor [Clavibacter michiganensis subsp. insidiosus]